MISERSYRGGTEYLPEISVAIRLNAEDRLKVLGSAVAGQFPGLGGPLALLNDARNIPLGTTYVVYCESTSPLPVVVGRLGTNLGDLPVALATVNPGEKLVVDLLDNSTQGGSWVTNIIGAYSAAAGISGSGQNLSAQSQLGTDSLLGESLWVIGGVNGGVGLDVQRYDPEYDAWQTQDIPGTFAGKDRAVAELTILDWDGGIFAVGGDQDGAQSVEYRGGAWTSRAAWSTMGATIVAGFGFRSEEQNNRVYAFDGAVGQGQYYSRLLDSWVIGPSSPSIDIGANVVESSAGCRVAGNLSSSRVGLVCDQLGQTSLYEEGAGWTAKDVRPSGTQIRYSGASFLDGNEIMGALYTGGQYASGDNSREVHAFRRLDGTGTLDYWQAQPWAPAANSVAGGAYLGVNRRTYFAAAGGGSFNTSLISFERGFWSTHSALPTAVSLVQETVTDGPQQP